ncbi:helix-turn-helix domain-containing protein [Algoriphagus taiwanensis]|uniref:Helix-turn-helix domain-containing protein n=1 Tax=Algoriphagus taiwanensis TaxID=1445656 RepID=A0ABQ6PWP7_9BACT|nr:helix-turn-helix domain-containing protein [Algoriphagus taiwanensis]
MIFQGPSSEKLQLEEIDSSNCFLLKEKNPSELTFVWFLNPSILIIDGIEFTFQANQAVCLTEFHRVEVKNLQKARLLRFNRAFFCILDHDSEIGCKGVLFFGSAETPVINLFEKEIAKLEALWKVFEIEIQEVPDPLQLEMLQILLKRLLILCTRIYKSQQKMEDLEKSQVDLIREFNYLVETHFKTKHTVADYADLLFKSPKTLSNLFSKLGEKSPLSFIHDRKMLEARRLLGYTDQSIKEIGHELGFEDIQSFSRFFKKNEGLSPSDFKEKLRLGKIANSSGNTA